MTSNFLQVGRAIRCGHCCPKEFQGSVGDPCTCICHDSPKIEVIVDRMNKFIQSEDFKRFVNDVYQITGAIEGMTQGG